MEDLIKVLHITPDDKFFDDVYERWCSVENISCEAYFITNQKDYQLKYIKNISKVKVLTSDKFVKDLLLNGEYDVLCFHSLHPRIYKYFKYIPQNKIVIWWMWGCDVYFEYMGLSPVIPLDLYKPTTTAYKKSKDSFLHNSFSFVYHYFDSLRLKKQRDHVLSRIDYFQPVLQIEYAMMNRLYGFRASEFYYLDSWKTKSSFYTEKPSKGNILLGNSATASNNHLDILNVIKQYQQKDQTIIAPLNYGEEDYKEWIVGKIEKEAGVQIIKDFIPKDDYFNIVDSCSYACFGVVRQQAMSNILYAIMSGIKVFLYKDSIPYMDLKKMGFVVFAIEEIDKNSFCTPITLKEMEQNIEANKKEFERRNCVFKQCIDEIRGRVKQLQVNRY